MTKTDPKPQPYITSRYEEPYSWVSVQLGTLTIFVGVTPTTDTDDIFDAAWSFVEDSPELWAQFDPGSLPFLPSFDTLSGFEGDVEEVDTVESLNLFGLWRKRLRNAGFM